MKKIVLSIGSIVFAAAAVAGATGAFYNQNPWSSTGNTFGSGIVDLQIDNESYITNNQGVLVKFATTSWSTPVSSLAGKYFFKFSDVKPGDLGEDTISLHVKDNDAWLCMNVKLGSTTENGIQEPEQGVDTTAGANQGELQNVLQFAFWADDGDNVYETGEQIFKQGAVNQIFDGVWWTLADASKNLWSAQGGPIPGNAVRYVGKAWCYGTLTPAPVSPGTTGPLVRGTGFTCNGANLNNLTQSDGISADVNFTAAQYRSDKTFLCSTQAPSGPPTGGGTGDGDDGDDDNPPPPPQTATTTLFTDNFQSYAVEHFFDDPINDPKWDVGGDDVHVHNEGTNRFANLEGGHTPATQSLITQSISTLNHHDIKLTYDRKTDDTSGPVNPQTLAVEYSINGGAWISLEVISGETAWTTKTWNLPVAVNNKASLKVRFVFNGTNSTNHAYIDNVVITGITP